MVLEVCVILLDDWNLAFYMTESASKQSEHMTDIIFIVTEPFSNTWCLMKGAIVILEETTPTRIETKLFSMQRHRVRVTLPPFSCKIKRT